MLEEIERKLQKKKKIEKKVELGVRGRRSRNILIGILLGLIATAVLLFLNKKIAISFISFFIINGLFFLALYFRGMLKKAARVRKIENAFPDFLQLMASNLRAGMTIDKAMLLSSRPEFAPLDKEILNVGKDIATGKSIESALLDMTERVKSEKVKKTVSLIISGIKAGGNLAILLEETSRNMRERFFVEKRAASSVLMYVIFIFLAVSVGAPVLFSLSSILVETLSGLLSGMPEVDTSMNVPFTMSGISVSVTFIRYFALTFMVSISILSSLILGLVSKGEEKEGLKYLIPILAIGITLFFVIRLFLSGFMAQLFGS